MPTAIKFKYGHEYHELSGGITACRIRLYGRLYIARVNAQAEDITCWMCKKNTERLRPREGECLIAQCPDKKPVHLVTEKPEGDFPTPCKLNFGIMPNAVKHGSYSDVTCYYCMRISHC